MEQRIDKLEKELENLKKEMAVSNRLWQLQLAEHAEIIKNITEELVKLKA